MALQAVGSGIIFKFDIFHISTLSLLAYKECANEEDVDGICKYMQFTVIAHIINLIQPCSCLTQQNFVRDFL
jgi:hypothetical protein